MLVVQKYGGSSVANPERIKNVARRIIETKNKGNEVVVVVSALGGETDRLIRLAHEICQDPPDREMDMMLSTGEQVSIALLAMAIQSLGTKAVSYTGAQVGIVTDQAYTKARIKSIQIPDKIRGDLENGVVVIVAGFQGIDEDQNITTLGRGGSDTTAVALATVFKADLCEIFTDVDGVYTTDPRIVPEARKIPVISYEEMLEMASLGAKVMQSRSIEFAGKYGIDLRVRSSFSNDEGTLITKEAAAMEAVVIRGVTLQKEEAKITVTHLADQPGVAAKVFKLLAAHNINVDMIVQNVGDMGHTDISFTVGRADMVRTRDVLQENLAALGAREVNISDKICKVSVVGIGMRSHAGVAATMFDTLARAGVNIQMISTSEIKISCILDAKDGETAVRVLHSEFKLAEA